MSSQQMLYVGDATFYPGPSTINVIAVDAQWGTSSWQTTLAQAGTTEGQSLQLVDGIVYTATNFRGKVHALQKSDGHELWNYESAPGCRVFGLMLDKPT